MDASTLGSLKIGETTTGTLDNVDDNVNAPEHTKRVPRGDLIKIEGLTAGNSYRVRAWFGTSKEDSATAARGGAIGLQFSRSGIELASLSPHNDNLLDDGRASFVFPAFANEEYYVDLVAPAFRPPHWTFPAAIYYGPYMLEIYDLGVTQRRICVGETCSLNEGYGVKATNICVNNRCFNDPRFPGFHVDGYENTETREVSVSKNFLRGGLFKSLSNTSTARFQLDRVGVFLHSMTAGSIPQAAVHTLSGLYPGDKLFDLEPLYNDDAHIDYFIAPQGAQVLNRGTTYAVIFTEGGGSSDSYKLYVTSNINDDEEDRHPKWYVENAGVSKEGGAAWGTMSSDDTSSGTQVLPQIRVYAGVAE